MLGIRYIKAKPSDFVILFRKGKIVQQGAGLSFFYYAPSASLVIVPAESRDAPFIFKESTNDFQTVDVQGQITFRVGDAPRLARMLDFTVDAQGRYLGDGLETLPMRLTNQVQVILREKLQTMDLRRALTSAPELVTFVRERVGDAPIINELGLEILDFSILSISSTPEIARALEAAARENLLKEADDAIYTRRNFAVEQERVIKENELKTQIAVEEKNREIRETQMNAEISVQEKQKLVEEARMDAEASIERKRNEIAQEGLAAEIEREGQREKFVEQNARNTLAEAKARADSVKLELEALATLSPELLEVLAANQMDARKLISKSIGELVKNADKIGTLNISPDLLESLLDRPMQTQNRGD
ncbi:MAG: SPFH domain-containing protein [bacterium]|nr:SPFH domain-containing protein [bacterium]